jgi:hypothetical protein
LVRDNALGLRIPTGNEENLLVHFYWETFAIFQSVIYRANIPGFEFDVERRGVGQTTVMRGELMTATQRREINREKQTEKSNLHRWFGTPLWVASQSWQRTLEFQELATAFSDHVSDMHKRVERRIERLLGQPLPKRR